jgi:hypothetical protein
VRKRMIKSNPFPRVSVGTTTKEYNTSNIIYFHYLKTKILSFETEEHEW